MIKNVNGRYINVSFYIRSHLLFGVLYPGTIVRYHILTESVGHKSPFYIPDIDLISKKCPDAHHARTNRDT
jgi:hypothetical protein